MNTNLDYNSMHWGAIFTTAEAMSLGVEMCFDESADTLALFQGDGKPITVKAVCPPDPTRSGVVQVDEGHYIVTFVHLYEAGPVLRVKTPKGVFFLAHSRGRVVTYTT